MLYNFLFPTKSNETKVSFVLLMARVVFGVLFMLHGIQKLNAFDSLSTVFPDPLGVGSQFSLTLAIFGELVCSVAFIAGLLYRLATIPMIFTMLVAFFVVHGADAFAAKELSFVYLAVFVLMYVVGAGKFSVDYFIGNKLQEMKR